MTNRIHNWDDLIERLAECAVGTETMKDIEQFIEHKKNQEDWQRKRIRVAAESLGMDMINEMMSYE